jgi:regulator of sirC expression with transglutaminase-like and TPR domain
MTLTVAFQSCLRGWPRARRLALILLVASFAGITAPGGAAESTRPPKKNPEPTTPAPQADSAGSRVEALTAQALQSVVVISHAGRDGQVDGVATGFVVDRDGLIATSLHVIGEARPVTVDLPGGRRREVTAIHAWDRRLDLAVIRIDATNLTPLALGDSDQLKRGTAVLALGNPQGLEHSVVQGLVSATRDVDGVAMIQVAIPVEPGNSGGPLLDLRGQVQGILTLKSAVTPNLGFAMPVNALKSLLEHPNPVPMKRWLTIGALNAREWVPLFGARWTQRAGRIQVEGSGKGFGGRSLCLSQRVVPAAPYELEVSVRLEDEAGAAGLVFASDGNDRHFGFYPSAGQMRLTRFEGPDVFSWRVLEQVPSPAYRRGSWNTLKVRVEPERVRCYVNGELAIEHDDTDFAGARVGLAKFRDTRAEFRNFQLGRQTGAKEASTDVPEALRLKIEAMDVDATPLSELVETLQPHAAASQRLLQDRAQRLEEQAGRLRRAASAVHQRTVEAELVRALAAPEDRIDLFHAAMLLARLDNPELDVANYRRQLRQMAAEVKSRLPAGAVAGARLEALVSYLFAENGFHGSRLDYGNRANSYLNEVMDDREGLPITLSVLFLELARQSGLTNVAGVPLPGRFLVMFVPADGPEQLIDVFDGGRTLTRDEAEQIVLDTAGVRLREEHLRAATKREIIVRMLRNLLATAQDNRQNDDALRYLDALLAIEPGLALERLNRAMLRLRIGDRAGAKEDLRWLLDADPPGIDTDRLADLYRSL